ncbi:hypothetical protein HMP0721_1620 [Pseudoramibacter alactolyticus ATCC 23263]|jgi:hypothetical protein|uniref:Uncharacterized protein n=1 Tax=Pseudoramibacter alactolyticus ATCC 23263 TaxID=887929 RepID=E6MI87_9FIRM|nr:hypothetical protein HMP0721_1620 [Pseudoramibacter alactolyticus ATCC 23263]
MIFDKLILKMQSSKKPSDDLMKTDGFMRRCLPGIPRNLYGYGGVIPIRTSGTVVCGLRRVIR